MIFRGFRNQTYVDVSHLFVVCWILANVTFGGTETVEIVTPENTRTTTTETSSPSTSSPPRTNSTNEWTGNDSYLQAYREVHKLQSISKRNDPNVLHERPAKKRQDQAYNTLLHSSHVADDKYPSLTHHHWPPMHFHSPPVTYGSFDHPPVHYHDDTPTRTCHGMPYSSPSSSFLSLLPKKLTLKLLFKIILKLVLFKMLVKFIAVICLLLFIPSLNSKETEPENDGEEKRKAKQLDMISNLIWDSISEKHSAYGQEDEMDDIERIAEEADEEPSDSGLEKAVRFLQFCVSAVDRVVLFLLGYLKRQRNEEDDLATFFLDNLNSLAEKM